jgi:hypothetical protein
MKPFLVLAALLLTVWGGPAWGHAKHPEPRMPYISSQHTEMVIPKYASPYWDRFIAVRNPLRKPVWFWLECESRLTTNAIGLRARHTDVFTFPEIPPEEKCIVNHWEYQRRGHRPKEWRP